MILKRIHNVADVESEKSIIPSVMPDISTMRKMIFIISEAAFMTQKPQDFCRQTATWAMSMIH